MSSSPFELDPFQQGALAALARDASVLVAAPTGAGKTVVAEAAIERALRAGKRAIYASPIKALSNQKYTDFCARFRTECVGILTGDRQENPGAPLLVLTTEILHNRLITGELQGLQDVATLVFDEFHYLSDPERGSVWEDSIILCPAHVQIVCLSATLPNVDDLAAWMAQHVARLEVVVETKRPVPLSFHYFAGGQLHAALDRAAKPDAALKRFDVRPSRGLAPTVVDLLPVLLREQMVPALCFVLSRRDAERFAATAARWLAGHVPPGPELESRLQAALATVDSRMRTLPQCRALEECLRQGAGFHHAGLLPELKQVVEKLFGEGMLRVLCATETFAVGLNMPARTVVLPRLTKFDGRMHRGLSAREFQQMIGRAGRRGMDREGHVVVLADPWTPFKDVARLLASPLEPISSAFGLSYNTLLNVSAVYGDEAADAIVSGSFLVYQLGRELGQAQQRLADLKSESITPNGRKQAKVLERETERLRGALELGRHQKELAVMRSALAELGYDAVAPKARLLRGVFNEHALLLAELLDDERLGSASWDVAGFAEVLSWFVDDLRRKAPSAVTAKLSPELRRARQILEDITGRVQRAERRSGLLLTKAVAPTFPLLIYKWSSGHALSALCLEYQIAEGDFGAHLERTRQLLRQVSRAASSSAKYYDVAALAAAGLRKVQAQSQLEDGA